MGGQSTFINPTFLHYGVLANPPHLGTANHPLPDEKLPPNGAAPTPRDISQSYFFVSLLRELKIHGRNFLFKVHLSAGELKP